MKRLMKLNYLLRIMLVGIPLFVTSERLAAGDQLPVIQGEKVVAVVNGEAITLGEFRQGGGSSTVKPGEDKKAGDEAESALLQRLINTRLIIQEGKRMGLDELPEIRKMVDVFAKTTLREELIEHRLKNVKADEKAVERLYKQAVKEWKVSSVLFEKEDDAKKMAKELGTSQLFDELTKRAVAAGAAKEGELGQYVKVRELSPEVAKAVSTMKLGSVSPVIPVKQGFVLVRLEGIRYTDNPEEKERARQEALAQARLQALTAYNGALIKKSVKVHKEVLGSIDYESEKPGFQELLKDSRVIAEVKGQEPITVGDLSQHLRQQLYHGVDQAIARKRLNSKKRSALDEMLSKKVFRKEALRLGLDKTDRYRAKVKEHEDSLVFGAFVQKAVVPDVKLKEEDLKTYYEQHLGDYTFPAMVRIKSLVFQKRNDAEGAIEKLRKGVDFQWLRDNAEGQVDKESKGVLELDGKLLTVADLPEGAQKVVSGSKSGDLRVYAAPEGYFYSLFIQEVVPAKPMPYEEARETVARKVFDDKLKTLLDEWTDKLRAVSEIKVYWKEGG
jgi:parvulin-like peptidyl-prolyl isomerase